MYFNFDDDRPDTPRITQPFTRREVVLVTINLHALVLILILLGPRLPWVREALEARQQEMERIAREELERKRDQARFVFVQPRVEMTAKPTPRADLSDIDRRPQTMQRAPQPNNPLPFSRGNSPELIEAEPPAATRTPAPAPTPDNGASDPARPDLRLPEAPTAPERPAETRQTDPRGPAVGVIADAIRNVRKYAQQENFSNPRGGQDQNLGESIQFDSKGVDFGPWLARFLAQVRAAWIPLIPQAAMVMHGNTSIQLTVHRNGRITDVVVLRPSTVDAFTIAARNALLVSNPTLPLPVEYPDDRMPMIITFYYNERPPGR